MENSINQIFANGTFLVLTFLVAGAFFFAMTGLRELTSQAMEGFFYLAFSVFFLSAHLYLLLNLPLESPLGSLAAGLTLWTWLVVLYAPALIGLFVVLGIFSFFVDQHRAGLVKLFFGLTLICYLYMIGGHWAIDVKGILIMVYGGIWFNLELRTT